ncbi:MAG: CNNM domain-containing protein [Planctomycetota bacterium]|jgi:CBS domain containing-hemolysin-like protein
MANNLILILLFAVALGFAALFSGAETGLYQFSRLRLRLGIEKRRRSFIILGKAVTDSRALLFAMLIGNNLANYLATSIVTVMLLGIIKLEHTAELFATLITAPVLLVFSELIPKSIFFYRADSLMPLFSGVLFVFHRLFTWSGFVPLLKGLSNLAFRLTGADLGVKTMMPDARPSYIKAITKETREEAFLSPVQIDIVSRISSIPNIRIRSVMTPINKVQMLDRHCDNALLLEKLKQQPFTRLPVYDHGPDNIIGFVNIYDCLGSDRAFTDLTDFIAPICTLSAEVTVADAINIMQKQKHKIVLVTRQVRTGRQRPLGIVTMKDLVEELLGELTEW